MSRAAEAKQILENPIIEHMFVDVREKLVQSIEDCPLDDDLMRNQLMLSLQILVQIKEQLIEYIADGQMEDAE
jgi:hypothetical protein